MLVPGPKMVLFFSFRTWSCDEAFKFTSLAGANADAVGWAQSCLLPYGAQEWLRCCRSGEIWNVKSQSLVTWCDMSSQYITVVTVPGAALGWKHGEWFFVPWVRPHQFRPWRLLTRSMLSEFCRGVLSVVSLLSDSQYEYGWRKRYHLQNKWRALWSTIQLGLSCTLSGVRQLGCWNRAA